MPPSATSSSALCELNPKPRTLNPKLGALGALNDELLRLVCKTLNPEPYALNRDELFRLVHAHAIPIIHAKQQMQERFLDGLDTDFFDYKVRCVVREHILVRE